MLQSVCYAFIYLFEVLACFMFFEHSYVRKVNKVFCFIAYSFAFVVQYGFSFATIPYINLITFVICNFLIALICYKSKIKSCIFDTAMLSFFMFITELIVIYSSTFIFEIYYLAAWEGNVLALILQSSLSKLLFFVVIFFLSRVFKRNAEHETNKFTILLGILPLTSMVNYCIMFYWGVKTYNTSEFNGTLAICAILLLFANLFVFYIYELVQKTNLEITQLQLEKQRGEISTEYYGLLSNEYEKSRILIHDIKNHLRYIENKTTDGKSKEVLNYIDSIREDFGLNEISRYSGNGLIDVIINRHANYCKSNGLKCEIEACCSKLEFMNDSDITSLLDNLFDNAIDAAMKSTNKKIVFSMYVRSDTFVVISLINSCDVAPNSSNGKLISSKKNPVSHGYGTKSIRRVVNKYDGDFQWTYDEANREFEARAILFDKNLVEKIETK